MKVFAKPNGSMTLFGHRQRLAALSLLFAAVNGFVLAIWIAMFLFLVVMPSRNPDENNLNLLLVIILSTVFAFVVAIPLTASYGLLKKRRWATKAMGISVILSLLFSGFLSWILVWKLEEYYWLLYLMLCLATSVYSGWYAWRKRAG